MTTASTQAAFDPIKTFQVDALAARVYAGQTELSKMWRALPKPI